MSRLARLFAGLALFGVSVAMMLAAGLGVDSWDVFHQGVAQHLGVGIGAVIVWVSIGVLLLWIPLRQRPGIGTIANAVVVGIVADLALRMIPTPDGLAVRFVLLAVGIVANGAATGLYIGAGLGPGPRDGLMTGLAARTGYSIRRVRTGIEITVLAVGAGLGGPIGVGTVAYALSIGPMTQFFLDRFVIPADPRHAARIRGVAGVCP
ncbi:MAG: hypothetical protein WBV06_17555 [Acidimicrobiia bacterium]|jgi:uncharacterized membrane protein YczE